MANFFLDNDDIQFLFNHIDWPSWPAFRRTILSHAADDPSGYAPQDAADAVDNYRRILEIVGEMAGDMIAPNAEQVDHEGNTLNDDGTVTLHPLVQQNLDRLTQADMMGFTLPRKYGGLNCPSLVYTMANEIVSRADCSLMNLFGLQGIAETIYAFANDEIKRRDAAALLPRRSDRRDGADRARRRQRPAGRAAAGLPGRAGQLVSQRREAVHHQRLRRDAAGAGPQRAGDHRRPRPEPVHGRAVGAGEGSPPGEQAGHPRLAHLRVGVRQHACRLIGERQRGLITYVMALMNGARVGIAAQSLGIAEAAYRLARTYAHTRKQFGGPIERLPAVAEMVTDMKIDIEAARALTYETARVCDHENNNLRVLELGPPLEKEEEKRRKQLRGR